MPGKQLPDTLACLGLSLDFSLMKPRNTAAPSVIKSLDGKCLLVGKQVFLIPHHGRSITRTENESDPISTKPVISSAKRRIERPFIQRDFSD